VDIRGKSAIPESRIAIEESKSAREERREETEAAREAADEADMFVRNARTFGAVVGI
jgi:hypothetical protein